MKTDQIIKGKRVLAVDDEPDVLESLVELLDICKIDQASSFDEAKEMMEHNYYDLAILDIMGVNGYELLKIAKKRKIPALMLTANALTSDSLKRSAEEGAAYFAPKDEMVNIKEFAADVLNAIEKKKNPWVKMFERLGDFYDRRFSGPDWREKESEYWKQKLKQRFPM
jgi:DNA-binding response OmpR family regulator